MMKQKARDMLKLIGWSLSRFSALPCSLFGKARANKTGLSLIRCLCLVLLLVYQHDSFATEEVDTESNGSCMKIEEAVLVLSLDEIPFMDGPLSSDYGGPEISIWYCAYLTLSQKIKSVDFIMGLYKKTPTDIGKLYLLKWLWDHDRKAYKKAKKLINRDGRVRIIPSTGRKESVVTLMEVLSADEILIKIENGVEIDAGSLINIESLPKDWKWLFTPDPRSSKK